jgi:DNA-binding transcriptional MocR family regulator
MSKAFFPGLRIAITAVPDRFLCKFTQAVTNTVWMAPAISSELVSRLIESGAALEIINKKRKVIARRLQLAKTILKDFSFKTT